MKYLLITFILLGGILSATAQTINKMWVTDSTLATPESVLPAGKLLYVSLIDGGGWEADGKGGIGILDSKGIIINSTWITGLNAPKGMAIVNGILYAADITEIVAIDIKKGEVITKQKVEGAVGLNDISADKDGTVYVSDSRTGKVHAYKNGITSLYLENLNGVNGLKWHKGKLYIGANSAFLEYNPITKILREICKLENGGDGIEPYKDGFFVTAWAGYLYYIDKNGNRKTLRETHETNKFKTADIGIQKNMLYMPTFFGNTVEAWKIN